MAVARRRLTGFSSKLQLGGSTCSRGEVPSLLFFSFLFFLPIVALASITI